MKDSRIGNPALASRLRQVMRGDVLFGAFDRGRYSTDASIYQIEPIGIALPKGGEDIEAAIALAREEGFPVIARGGGSSQNGQTLGEAVVLDTSRYMNQVLEIDKTAGTALVQPGIVLDELNRQLKGSGWYFPVDVSTSANATIGGMTGNNSAGTRSIKYGIMVHNVLEVEAVLADGARIVFGELPDDLATRPGRLAELARAMLDLARQIPTFRATIERLVRGAPDALLLVEFAGDEETPLLQSLGRLEQLLADHGYSGSVVRTLDAKSQADMTAVRKAGLNIMMSMKGDGKPVSFIEDCVVPLGDLAEFTERLTKLFRKHGTQGTWYAHP